MFSWRASRTHYSCVGKRPTKLIVPREENSHPANNLELLLLIGNVFVIRSADSRMGAGLSKIPATLGGITT